MRPRPRQPGAEPGAATRPGPRGASPAPSGGAWRRSITGLAWTLSGPPRQKSCGTSTSSGGPWSTRSPARGCARSLSARSTATTRPGEASLGLSSGGRASTPGAASAKRPGRPLRPPRSGSPRRPDHPGGSCRGTIATTGSACMPRRCCGRRRATGLRRRTPAEHSGGPSHRWQARPHSGPRSPSAGRRLTWRSRTMPRNPPAAPAARTRRSARGLTTLVQMALGGDALRRRLLGEDTLAGREAGARPCQRCEPEWPPTWVQPRHLPRRCWVSN